MSSMMIEAVVLAFCVGGVFGAIVAVHLQYSYQRKHADRHEHNTELKQARIPVQHRRHK